jgi:AraC-like DNA-binding protein
VAPIVRGDEHRLTLFGGPARSGPIPPEDLVPEARHAWRQLPLPDPARLAAAANLLTALGQALLVLLDGQIAAGGGRKAAIDRLIEARMHAELGPAEIGPAEIGQALGLSPSRAAHVVTGLYGMPFGELLRERRLARARHLLLTGDDPVGAVGRRCGFASQHWFNRIFARATGEPPARWRRRQRRQA